MKLTAPYIWIMTSGIYDVLQIWDQDGSVSYFDIYANSVKVYTLEKDDDISYIEIEKLDLPTNCEPSHGYNIGVIGYDSDGQCSEDSNVVCWYSDGEFDNDGADPGIIAPFKQSLNITFYLDGVKHGFLSLSNYDFSEDGLSTIDATATVTRNKYNNGVTINIDGIQSKVIVYDYKTPIDESITLSRSELSSSDSFWSLAVYATSSNDIRYKFHRHSRGNDIENPTAKARRYGDFTAPTDCIVFVSDTDDFTLSAYKKWDGTVEYSTDRSTWTTWDGSSIASNGQKLYLRGYDNTRFYVNNTGARFVLSLPARCYGNINTLLQYDNPPLSIPSTLCYSEMFAACTNLTQAPALPATTLADYCYDHMFSGCTTLTQVPELPATTLATCCYQYMFSGCTNLTQAPALPATTLVTSCYDHMFYGCTNLTQAPALPATTLANYCYAGIFSGCTNLTQAPELPATTLANYCYNTMFSGCTNLTQAPALPVTTLKIYCYDHMFSGCTTLTQVPELPATTLATCCYQYMFSGCTNLTQAPALPATTLVTSCYDHMFYGCTNLTQAPALPATTLANYCYAGIFSGCTNLTQAPELPATTLANYCYNTMFSGCTNLTQAPALPVTTLKIYCYAHMFSACTNLTQAPALPATTLANYCYYGMFHGCTSLTQAPELPVTTLATSCYREMFYGCTNLTQAPALPATTLANYCYYAMFRGCSNIKLSATQTGEYTQAYRIPTSGTGNTASSALNYMFTSTGGTFTGTPEINTTYYLHSSNTIV